MKGFIGAFLVFIFWATGGIYYISTTNLSRSYNLAPQKVNTSTVVQSKTPKSPTSATNDKEPGKIPLENVYLGDSLDKPYAYTSNSKLLAEELRKSITISDTIDINKGEPEIAYIEEILEEEEEKNSLLFYPRYTKSSELILDRKLVDYANELKKILKENPDKRVTIIGHTDNIGNAKDNFAIGLKKSRQVKWYLTVRKGIKRSFIKAISKGEQEPVESNYSNWGRMKNNRIEIIVE